MIVSDRVFLTSQLNFFRERLEKYPETSRVMRLSTESRIRTIEAQLLEMPDNEHKTAVAQLTFRGRPVIGSHGIYADFAVKAVARFSEAVAMVASSFRKALPAKGPIPNRDRFQLVIVGTALGSFGFELEEAPSDELPLGPTPVAEALKQTQELFRASMGTDDQLAEAAAAMDDRALAKIRDFFGLLTSEEATCALAFVDESASFATVNDVRRGWERLSTDNLKEEEVTVDGKGLLALNMSRLFEIQPNNGDLIIGKVAPEVANIETVNAKSSLPVRVKLLKRVFGTGKPKYVLLHVLDWGDDQFPANNLCSP